MDRDEAFLRRISGRLAGLPGVHAVALGGSRAHGTHRPDSDWDLAIYYRGGFDPQALREIGWPGTVSEIGAWGGGVFNGGAWLSVEGRNVDVHYRDLAVVEHEIAEASAGRFHIEPLMFHLAGIPSYLVVGELAANIVLHGALPRPAYPEALRHAAPPIWWTQSELVLDYAAANHAPYGRVAQCTALIAQAVSQAAHAVLAARGEWVTNEKTLLERAGLDAVDAIVTRAHGAPDALGAAVVAARELCRTVMPDAAAG